MLRIYDKIRGKIQEAKKIVNKTFVSKHVQMQLANTQVIDLPTTTKIFISFELHYKVNFDWSFSLLLCLCFSE